MTRASDHRTRRALLIGVDAYANRPLDGCVADARLIDVLLRERFDFREENVRLLLNGEATRDAVLSALDALVDLTAENDVAFVFYAGHGSMMVDADGDETSGFDNTLMVSDSPRQDITDDELRARLDALGEKTPFTTLVFDACNSGTMARDADGPNGRFYPPLARPAASRGARDTSSGKQGPSPPGASAPGARHVVVAACRDGEIANEDIVAGDPGVHHGALTVALARALELARAGETWRDVFARASRAVTVANPAQHPQLEGDADRELFGLRERPPIAAVQVTDRSADTVVLSTGAVRGATVGSTYAIHPEGTKEDDHRKAIGRVELVVVKGTSSRGRIVEERTPGAIVVGALALEAMHVHTEAPLTVHLAGIGGGEREVERLRHALDTIPVLEMVSSPRSAALRVLWLAPRSAVGRSDPLPQLGLFTTPRWAIIDRGGRLVVPADPEMTEAQVIDALVRRARTAAALALDNADQRSRMRGKVTLAVLRRGTNAAWEVATASRDEDLPVFDSGDPIAFRITSTLEEAVFVTVADVDPLGAIGFLTTGSGNILAAGKTFEIGTQGRLKRLRWDGPDAVESFKLFASRRPVDFSFLQRGDVGARAVEDVAPLSDDDWSSELCQIVVRRRVPVAAAGRRVQVDGMDLTFRGLTGVVRAAPSVAAVRGARRAPSPLEQALDESDLVEQQALLIADTAVAGDAARDGESPSIELQLPALGEDVAQVAMTVDEHGVIAWHFAPVLDDDAATRGEPGAVQTRTFHIPVSTRPAAAEGDRGIASAIGQKLIKVYAFPIARKAIGHVVATYGERLELQRTPYRVRSFLPDDYASPQAAVVDDAEWARLGAGRALLMIHGTNSRTHTAFGGLPRPFVELMHERYAGRVFAFDHPTLTHTPRQNVEWLLANVPAGLSLDVDIICHSRGGLVSRVISEKLAELAPEGRDRTIRVRRLVFVAAPNAGTRLADEACIGDYIDTATNLLDALPTNGATDAIGYLLTAVKLVATGLWSSLAGLQSMRPGGPFGAWLNAGERGADVRYFALASNYTPREPRLAQLVADRLMDRVFKQVRNDMVVPTDGVYDANGSGYFPITDQLVLGAADGVAHTQFFQYPRSTAQIAAWLAS